jgi:glutamate racemase
VTRPVGVFDSGIGGLSVLQALHAELPHQSFVYVADSAHAPYGERDDAYITRRTLDIARHLVREHNIQALVVACNTATAAAIHVLRAEFADLPLVGVEPALKPASLSSQTHRVGVLATRSTLNSAKFQSLHAALEGQAHFALQACDGLASAIEAQDEARIRELAQRYVAALGPCGTAENEIDTVVLGCTHYPLIQEVLQSLLPSGVQFVESGAPVARQTRRVLPEVASQGSPQLSYFSTGDAEALRRAAQHWLSPQAAVQSCPV